MIALETTEKSAWSRVDGSWRPLYGNFDHLGLSIEHHEFKTQKPLNWSKSFHPQSLEVCLNLAGQAKVQDKSRASTYLPQTVGFYCNGADDLKATREADQNHAFITVEMSREFIHEHVAKAGPSLHPQVCQWLSSKQPVGAVGDVMSMTGNQQTLFLALSNPPVPPAAYPLWYQSKVLELLVQVLFAPSETELFCQRQKRVSRERVEKTVAILRARFAEPPDLEALGSEVGSSPFYLSRLFSKETGMTIPQFLREIRMQRAAELLLSGTHNVTEAAMEVGYSSLSHFSKAFCQSIGCCPNLFPEAKALVAKFQERKRAGW